MGSNVIRVLLFCWTPIMCMIEMNSLISVVSGQVCFNPAKLIMLDGIKATQDH